MSKQLQLKIITPERLVLEEMVDSVTLPTTEGEISILADHVPLVAGLGSGDIVTRIGNDHVPMVIVGGLVEVKKDENGITTCAVLADFVEHVADITDEAIAHARARAAELKKLAENKEVVDFEHFATELERSLNRVKIADKWRTKKYRK